MSGLCAYRLNPERESGRDLAGWFRDDEKAETFLTERLSDDADHNVYEISAESPR